MTVVDEVTTAGSLVPESSSRDGGDAEAVLVVALEAFISTDPGGHVVAWNPAAERTFGWTVDQARGKLMEELIISPRCREAYRAALARLTTGSARRTYGQRLQLEGLHRDERRFPIELALTATRGLNGFRLHVFAHDITARRRLERFADAQAAVSRALADAVSAGRAGQAVVDAVGATLRWPLVELWLVDQHASVLVCAARHVRAGHEMPSAMLETLDEGVGVPGTVLATGSPVWVSDIVADPRCQRSDIKGVADLRAVVGVPVRSGDAVMGVLACYGDSPEDPEHILLALLGGIAAHLAQYLERRRAEELAVKLANAKDDMLSLVTHELRTPLSVILTYTEMLEDELDALSPEQRGHLGIVHRSADRLTTLINDLLDLARLESGQLTMRMETVDLGDIIRAATADVGPAALGKRLTLVVELPDPLLLHGDGVRLRQVADNLLSNALKYTPDGGTITVAARLGGQHIDWTVTDTGIGIPAMERAKVFQRFFRASTAVAAGSRGTGLGLVISRTIVEHHRGSIALESHDGCGTTFRIRFPVLSSRQSADR